MAQAWSAYYLRPGAIAVRLPGVVRRSADVANPLRYTLVYPLAPGDPVPVVQSVALPDSAHEVATVVLSVSQPRAFDHTTELDIDTTGWLYADGSAVAAATGIGVGAGHLAARYMWAEIGGIPETWPWAPAWSPDPLNPGRASGRVTIPGEYFAANGLRLSGQRLDMERGCCTVETCTLSLADLDGRLLELAGVDRQDGATATLDAWVSKSDAGPIAGVSIVGDDLPDGGPAWCGAETLYLSARAGAAPWRTYTVARGYAGSGVTQLGRDVAVTDWPRYLQGRRFRLWEVDFALWGDVAGHCIYDGVVDELRSEGLNRWTLRARDTRARVDERPWGTRLAQEGVAQVLDLGWYNEASGQTFAPSLEAIVGAIVTSFGVSMQFDVRNRFYVSENLGSWLSNFEAKTYQDWAFAGAYTRRARAADWVNDPLNQQLAIDQDEVYHIWQWFANDGYVTRIDLPRFMTPGNLAAKLSDIRFAWRGRVWRWRVEWDGEVFKTGLLKLDNGPIFPSASEMIDVAVLIPRTWPVIPRTSTWGPGWGFRDESCGAWRVLFARMGWHDWISAHFDTFATGSPMSSVDNGALASPFSVEPSPVDWLAQYDATAVGRNLFLLRTHARSDGTLSQDDLPSTAMQRGWDRWPQNAAAEAGGYFATVGTYYGYTILGKTARRYSTVGRYDIALGGAPGTGVHDYLLLDAINPGLEPAWVSSAAHKGAAGLAQEALALHNPGDRDVVSWYDTGTVENAVHAVARILHSTGLRTNDTLGYEWDSLPEGHGFAVDAANLDAPGLAELARHCPFTAYGYATPDERTAPWEWLAARACLPAALFLTHHRDGRVWLRPLRYPLVHEAAVWTITPASVAYDQAIVAAVDEAKPARVQLAWDERFVPPQVAAAAQAQSTGSVTATLARPTGEDLRTIELSPLLDGPLAAFSAAAGRLADLLSRCRTSYVLTLPAVDSAGVDWRRLSCGETVTVQGVPASTRLAVRELTGSFLCVATRWDPTRGTVEVTLTDAYGARRLGGWSFGGQVLDVTTRYVYIRADSMHTDTTLSIPAGLEIGDAVRCRWYGPTGDLGAGTTAPVLASVGTARKGVDSWRIDFGAGAVPAAWFLAVLVGVDADTFTVAGDVTGSLYPGQILLTNDANGATEAGYEVLSVTFGGVNTTVEMADAFAGALGVGAWVWAKEAWLTQAPWATASATARQRAYLADGTWTLDGGGEHSLFPPPAADVGGVRSNTYRWG